MPPYNWADVSFFVVTAYQIIIVFCKKLMNKIWTIQDSNIHKSIFRLTSAKNKNILLAPGKNIRDSFTKDCNSVTWLKETLAGEQKKQWDKKQII